jgi:hypothetical protein
MQRNILIALLMAASIVALAQPKKKRTKQPQPSTQTSNNGLDQTYRAPGSPMPPLRLVRLDGKVFTQDDFSAKKPMLVMEFNPTCDHCAVQTELMRNQSEQLKNAHVVLLAAPGMMEYLPQFERPMRLSEVPAFICGVDSSGFIDRTFNYESLPQINIYDKERKLVRSFSGVVAVDSLVMFLK